MPSGGNVCGIKGVSLNGDERLILHCKHLSLTSDVNKLSQIFNIST